MTSRTIYRDVADLQHQGVPIEGEAGVGYRLGSGFDLPPLMFTQDEAKALVVAVRVAQIGLDAALASSAETALGKILSVLPAAVRAAAESQAVYAPHNSITGLGGITGQRLQELREAVQAQRKVQITYQDPQNKTSQRTLRPLLLLGKGMDTGGVVRDQSRLSQLSGRPDSKLRGAGSWF